MKLRIVHQNQQNQQNRPVEEPEPTMKEESTGADRSAPVMEAEAEAAAETRVLSEEDENSPAAEPVAVASTVSHPMLLSSKRTRKKKELIDEISPILFRKKKSPKPSASKLKPGMVASGGITSNGDATAGTSNAPVKSPTVIRAEAVQAGLGSDLPNFYKVMVRSHVGSCFWMGFPVPFCKLHLPNKDATVVLENEEGEEFPIKYIAQKTGLSAGWRKFVTGNKLLEGDVVVFQLVAPCRFKVYIVRAHDLTEVDGALSLLILDSKTKPSDGDGITDAQPKRKRRVKSLPLTVLEQKQNNGPLSPPPPQLEEHSGNDSGEVASEVLENCKFPRSSVQFKDVNTFEQFQIVVNGVCIDSEIPEDIRRKYYDLCCCKNGFLHDRFIPGLYSKLAAGVVVETVNIAEALRNCKFTTPRNEFEVWGMSLRSFEILGFNVGFLQDRLKRLLTLVDSEGAKDTKRYLEAQMEWREVDHEIQLLEAKLAALRELSAKYDQEMQDLKPKAESHEQNFQEEEEMVGHIHYQDPPAFISFDTIRITDYDVMGVWASGTVLSKGV